MFSWWMVRFWVFCLLVQLWNLEVKVVMFSSKPISQNRPERAMERNTKRLGFCVPNHSMQACIVILTSQIQIDQAQVLCVAWSQCVFSLSVSPWNIPVRVGTHRVSMWQIRAANGGVCTVHQTVYIVWIQVFRAPRFQNHVSSLLKKPCWRQRISHKSISLAVFHCPHLLEILAKGSCWFIFSTVPNFLVSICVPNSTLELNFFGLSPNMLPIKFLIFSPNEFYSRVNRWNHWLN